MLSTSFYSKFIPLNVIMHGKGEKAGSSRNSSKNWLPILRQLFVLLQEQCVHEQSYFLLEENLVQFDISMTV